VSVASASWTPPWPSPQRAVTRPFRCVAVAERADVAVGTLYRYFPSKVHLLVSALGREFERIDAKTDRAALAAARRTSGST
jgi:hypothetical protein